MDPSNSLAFYKPLRDSERERVHELLRYYCAFNTPTETQAANSDGPLDPDAPTGDEQPIANGLPTDITLAALSQLGVFRTGSNRCFVSIIDGTNQFIISETTKSVSLRHKDKHIPDDGIYLGVRTLDLVWGVCPHTIKLFTSQDSSSNINTDNITANRSRYIIRDFTKEDCFKDRPYVRDWPHMRFYAEVPLFSAAGYVLGSYCVVDDKPRDNFDDEEVAVLQEVSDAIANHLENVRLVHFHRRAETLVKGLTSFVKETPEFEPTEASKDGYLVPLDMSLNLRHQSTDNRDAGDDFCSAHSGEQSGYNISILGRTSSTNISGPPLEFSQQNSGPTDPTSLYSSMSDRPTIMSPKEGKSLDEAWAPDQSNPADVRHKRSLQVSVDRVPIPERISMIFARASVLLRESMDLDGVVFYDASRSASSGISSKDPASWEPLPNTADPAIRTAPCPTLLALAEPDKQCDTFSYAFKEPRQKLHEGCQVEVTERFLHELMAAFPRGHIFNFDEKARDESAQAASPHMEPEALQKITTQLAQHIPVADSVIFLPLWDWNKSCWLAGTLMWTRKRHRTLGFEELNYFKVFGDSIVSEVSRLYWMTTEKSKFDFISSINHELRSPLHGILASTELLHATKLLPSQEDMVKMIEKSGMNLLDTTDHLLDFCQINNSTLVKKFNQPHTGQDAADLGSEFDLDHLVEDVADILYTGKRVPETSSGLVQRSSSNLGSAEEAQQVPDAIDKLSVVVRIDQSHTWKILSVAGAWRRIVMNLLGNAMKWTVTGFIEVSLSKARDYSDPESLLAHLRVTDTGKGITPDYLKHKLFAPFSQEDSLSEGVGLGLSIVRQLVASLGGHVTLKSELGIGTQADVYIPVKYLESVPVQPSYASSLTSIHACLVGFNAYPDLQETPTGILSAEEKRKLSIQSTLADVLMTRLGWNTSLAESLGKGQGDIAIIEEGNLNNMEEGQSPYGLVSKHDFRFFVILRSKVPVLGDKTPPNTIRVSQPFGPRKILLAAEKILKLRSDQHTSDTLRSLPSLSSSQTLQPSVPEPGAGPGSDSAESSLQEDSAKVVSTSTLSIRPANQPKGVHVLIVDDNDINLKIMATFMRKIGCSYNTATNGLVALEKYINSSQPFDFVLMDISMPVMDGLVSTSRIRQYEEDAGLKPSCIMAVTGVASAPMQQQAVTAGIDDYLIKPLSLRQLKKLMNIE